MKTESIKIKDDLFFVSQPNSEGTVATVPGKTEYILVIDCSGSMWDDLPLIREQLKNRLPVLLKEGDTVSIIWFSGRGEHGVLCKRLSPNNVSELEDIKTTIDRWLRPIGLTGFKEPLEDVSNLLDDISEESAVNFMFFSDGWDNQWKRNEVITAVTALKGRFASSVIVEYGFYADHNMLTEMANSLSATLIFSKDFDSYVSKIESFLLERPSGRVKLTLAKNPIDFAWTLRTDEIQFLSVDDRETYVSGDSECVYYLSKSSAGKRVTLSSASAQTIQGLYAGLKVYSDALEPHMVYSLLRATQDVVLGKAYSTCFSKQDYARFNEEVIDCIFNPKTLPKRKRNKNVIPAEDAFTIFDLLEVLMEDDENRILLDSPNFSYNKISRSTVSADENLSQNERRKVRELTDLLAKTQNVVEYRKIESEISAIVEGKKEALKFSVGNPEKGYPICFLTFNERRANISIGVRKNGTVDFSTRDVPDGVPIRFETFVYRNYALVKDGLINVALLPCRLTSTTKEKLRGRVDFQEVGAETWIYLDTLPILARKALPTLSANNAAQREATLLVARAEQKVFNYFLKKLFPEKVDSWDTLYGSDAKKWLKEQGLTEKGGFAPKKVVDISSNDVVKVRELTVKMCGYNRLPKVEDVIEKIESTPLFMDIGKKDPSVIMGHVIAEVKKFQSRNPPQFILQGWLSGRAEAATSYVRALLREKSQEQMRITVGQEWYKEFKSRDEKTIDAEVDFVGVFKDKVKATFDLREVDMKI